jgi:hypothetical protein
MSGLIFSGRSFFKTHTMFLLFMHNMIVKYLLMIKKENP